MAKEYVVGETYQNTVNTKFYDEIVEIEGDMITFDRYMDPLKNGHRNQVSQTITDFDKEH